jgi:hypothetical protein
MMATEVNHPSEPMGDFELPPLAAKATQHRKEVSWSVSTVPNGGKMTEIQLFPVEYQISANLSILNVLKKALTMFLATDPSVYIVSRVLTAMVLCRRPKTLITCQSRL